MTELLTTILSAARRCTRRSGLMRPLHSYLSARRIRKWERLGRPVPPPSDYKYRVIRRYVQRYRCDVAVETGTFYGAMVEALRRNVSHLYSVELDGALAEQAQSRFKRARNVTIIQGDSASVLPKIVGRLHGTRALYWLDAHFSGGVTARGEAETPILAELALVLSAPESTVVLIDDSREFGAKPEYPGLPEIHRLALSHGFSFEVAEDMIRLVRSSAERGE